MCHSTPPPVTIAVPSDRKSGNNLPYFRALTGVRAVAALSVFFFHSFEKWPTTNLPFLLKWGCQFIQQGHIGVNIFFVLSGFLIATRYAKGVTLSGQWFRHYLQNRFARIYPIYFLLTVLTFAVMVVRPTHEFYEWRNWFPTLQGKAIVLVANLTLTRAYFKDLCFIGLPTAWTLTVEETFYLLAPFLLTGLAYNRRLLYAYPLLLTGIGLVLIPICHLVFPHLGLMASVKFMLDLTFFGRCTEFLIGIGLFFWLRERPASEMGYATVAGIGGIILGMFVLALIAAAPEVSHYWPLFVSQVLLPFPIALLFQGLMTEPSRVRALLETKTFDLLGKSSYAFYLLHVGVVNTLFTQNITNNLLACLVAYGLLSIVLYKYVEHPLHKLFRSKQIV